MSDILNTHESSSFSFLLSELKGLLRVVLNDAIGGFGRGFTLVGNVTSN